MPRRPNPDLIKPWKVSLPATTAGRVEYVLLDPVHRIPLYGARGKLIDILLNMWLDKVSGREPRDFPSLDEIRSM